MIHRIFALSALLLALLVPAVAAQSAAAQPSGVTQLACSFDESSQQHREDQRRLGVTRGGPSAFRQDRLMPSEAGEQVPALADVTRWLGERVGEGSYPEQTYVLFYSRRPNRLCSWLIGPGGIAATGVTFGDPSVLAQEIWELMGSLEISERQIPRAARRVRGGDAAAPAPTDGSLAGFAEALERMSGRLFAAPIAEALGAVRHLVIVPTGDIGTLPFPALTPRGDRRPIVERFPVSIAPSLQSLAAPAGPWQPAAAFRRPLIVGNPSLPPSEDWNVPPLPGAEAEAREVARLLGTRPLLGRAALKERVVAESGGASLLWIATHGIADDIEGVNGGFLMLGADGLEEGWWTAREIQASRLQAELAVLSACQTGLGQAHAGGMIGLARAFQLAGVPRVVMSLWNVDDDATRMLMTRFVGLARIHSPAEALRRAMLEVRREHPHPSLWASFLMFGQAA